MGKFNISAEDLKRSVKLPTDWYPVRIKTIEDKLSAKKDSMNTFVEYVVIGKGKTTSFDGLDVPFNEVYNSKAPGNVQGLASAIAGRSIEPGEVDLNQETCGGVEIEAYIVNKEIFDNKTGQSLGRRNKPEEFRPLTKA